MEIINLKTLKILQLIHLNSKRRNPIALSKLLKGIYVIHLISIKIRAFEKQGLIKKFRNPSNLKCNIAVLTPKGKKIMAHLTCLHEYIQKAAKVSSESRYERI